MVFQWTALVNDWIAGICKMHPERVRGVEALPEAPGTTPKDWLEEAERSIEKRGFAGVLLNPDLSEGMNETRIVHRDVKPEPLPADFVARYLEE